MIPNTWKCEPVWQFNGIDVDMTHTHTRMSIIVNAYNLEKLIPLLDWIRTNYGNPAKQFDYDVNWCHRIRKTTTDVLVVTAAGKMRKVDSEPASYELHITMNAEIFAVFKLTWGLTPFVA